MERVRLAARALLAGIMISIGGAVLLSAPDRLSGAIFFSVGLFGVCALGLALFTGMAGYLLDGSAAKNALNLAIIWVGNLVGCLIVGLLLRSFGTIAEAAEASVALRLSKPLWYSFITAIFCGVLMYVAVDNFRNNPSGVGKYLGILLCVSAFILCGFEHSVADMFFIAAARGLRIFSGETAVFLLVVSAGNLVGSVAFATLRKFGKSNG